jgi:hypothetical protein
MIVESTGIHGRIGRELLRRAALSGLTIATASVARDTPLPVYTASADKETPEGFLAYAYAQRTQAMNTGDTNLLDPLYDSASSALIRFEKSRARFMYNGLMATWNRSVLLGYTSTVSVVDLQSSETEATAQLYEGITVEWISRLPPPQLTPETMARRRRTPEKYRSSGLGPNGEITSRIGVRHEIALSRGMSGWRLAKDGYHERIFCGASPDLVPGSWADAGGPGPANAAVTSPVVTMKPSSSTGTCQDDFQASVNYAHTYCCSGCKNTGYCYYCDCGGDCANFVSQCLSAGNEHWDSTWYCNPNHTCNCDSPAVAWAGSLAWVNVSAQHDWIIHSGRGEDVRSQNDLGLSDIINYDWYPPDGTWDHCAIVTNFDQYGNPLVSCHCYDRCDTVWWDGGQSGTKYRFTTIYIYYPC